MARHDLRPCIQSSPVGNRCEPPVPLRQSQFLGLKDEGSRGKRLGADLRSRASAALLSSSASSAIACCANWSLATLASSPHSWACRRYSFAVGMGMSSVVLTPHLERTAAEAFRSTFHFWSRLRSSPKKSINSETESRMSMLQDSLHSRKPSFGPLPTARRW
jgi:hypothetical protein